MSFAYDCGDESQEAKFAFLQSDVGKLNSEAFDNTTTYFYSCNSGTDDGNKGSFAQAWSNKTSGRSLGLKNARTLYAFINSTGNWGLYFGGGIALSPSDCWNFVLSKFGKASDSWKEKMDIKENRERYGKGYSDLGSLQYPWMVSLAGEFVDSGWLDAFDRHWAWYEPEECEG